VLRLKRGEERRLTAGHLWVFSNEVDTDATPLTAFAPGAVAELRTHRDALDRWSITGSKRWNLHRPLCFGGLNAPGVILVPHLARPQTVKAADV